MDATKKNNILFRQQNSEEKNIDIIKNDRSSMPNLLTLQLTCLHSNKKLWKQQKYISTSLYLLLNTERFSLIILSIQFFDRPCESNQIFLTMTVTLREIIFYFFAILGKSYQARISECTRFLKGSYRNFAFLCLVKIRFTAPQNQPHIFIILFMLVMTKRK